MVVFVCNINAHLRYAMYYRSRKITVRPMCGGKQCDPLAEVKRCPDAPPCLFKTPQAVRTTFLLSGVDADTYDANDDAIKATIKVSNF